MTINQVPGFKGTLGGGSTTFTSADTTAKKTLVGASVVGVSLIGQRIDGITVCSDDTATVNLAFYRFNGDATYLYIGNVSVSAGFGYPVLPVVQALFSLAPDLGYIDLKEGWSLVCNCVTTMTAGKTCTVTWSGGNAGYEVPWTPPTGAYTVVRATEASNSNNGANSFTADTINTVVHDMIVVGFASAINAITSFAVTDTAGNVYTLAPAVTGHASGTGYIRWAYCLDALPHASNVITVTAVGSTYKSWSVFQLRGGSRTYDAAGNATINFDGYDITTSTFSTTGVGIVLIGWVNSAYGNFTNGTFSGPEAVVEATKTAGFMQQGNYGYMLGTGAHANMAMTVNTAMSTNRLASAIAFR